MLNLTYQEFLTKLAEVQVEWTVNRDGQIRTFPDPNSGFCYCPLAAVVSKELGRHINNIEALHWMEPYPQPGIADEVILAADNWIDHDSAIRADLLRVLGLSEVSHV